MWSMSAKFEWHSGLLVKKKIYRLIVKDGPLVICCSLTWPKDLFGFFCKMVWKTQMNFLANPVFLDVLG